MLSKKLIIVATVFCLLIPPAVIAAEKKVTPDALAGINIVDTATVKKWLDDGEDFLILDARTPTDFEASHLPTAENYPVPGAFDLGSDEVSKAISELQAQEDLKDLEKDTKIVAYCNGYT